MRLAHPYSVFYKEKHIYRYHQSQLDRHPQWPCHAHRCEALGLLYDHSDRWFLAQSIYLPRQ